MLSEGCQIICLAGAGFGARLDLDAVLVPDAVADFGQQFEDGQGCSGVQVVGISTDKEIGNPGFAGAFVMAFAPFSVRCAVPTVRWPL